MVHLQKNVNFSGVWTALATPFDPKGQEIDWGMFEKMLAHQTSGGVRGVVISGTTGEAPTLSTQEKISLVRKAKALLPAGVQVMAGTGTNDTTQSVELSRLAQEAGADCLLIVTPPYNKPGVTGLLKHLETIGSKVNIPLCLYHVPGRTAQFLSVAAMNQICELSYVKAVKEASGDLSFFSKCVLGSRKVYLSGDDPTYLPSLAIGGEGVISVISNLFPKEIVAMTELFKKGNIAAARDIHDILMPLNELLYVETNPCPLKYTLSKLIEGFQNTFRLPLVEVTEENARRLDTALKTVCDRFKSLG